jgi:hypothetical protein
MYVPVNLALLFQTEMSGASWPDKLIYQEVTLKWDVCHYMYRLCYLYYSFL